VIKLLTSGGFGDAAMSLAKIHARFSDRIDDIELTHIRTRDDNLYKTIHDFYNTQSIKNKVIKIPSWDWQKENRKDFDYFLGCNWSEHNHNDESSWEINPFPHIQHSKISNCPILLNPTSGGTEEISKKFTENSIKRFMTDHPDVVLIGRGKDNYETYSNSMYNKTDINKLIDLITSSKIVITPEGFIAYFAAMCGNKVFVKNENLPAILKRKHPKWDMSIINDLSEITL
jgi:hypothetical protein